MSVRRWLLVAVLLVPGMTWAQVLTRPGGAFSLPRGGLNQGGGVRTSLAMLLSLNATGCTASGAVVGTAGETLTVSRASTAWYLDAAGAIQSCAANQARIGCDYGGSGQCGLLGEGARTNYALNSGTHPKTAQATATLPTGAYVAWAMGGTLTVATGTATVTGLSCSGVSAGTVCSFTVTVTGTVNVTTSAQVTHVQVEGGAYRTSPIVTAGSLVARSADVLTVTNPLVALDQWCVSGTFTAEHGRTWQSGTGAAKWAIGPWNTSHSTVLDESTATFRVIYFEGAGNKAYSNNGAVTVGSHAVAVSYNAGVATVAVDGAQVSMTPSGTGSVPTAQPLVIHLGGAGVGTREFNGFVSNFRVYRSASCK